MIPLQRVVKAWPYFAYNIFVQLTFDFSAFSITLRLGLQYAMSHRAAKIEMDSTRQHGMARWTIQHILNLALVPCGERLTHKAILSLLHVTLLELSSEHVGTVWFRCLLIFLLLVSRFWSANS